MEETEGKKYMYRGCAIIIANQNFTHNTLGRRKGAKTDLDMMTKLLTLLDFEVKHYYDLTEKRMRETLEKAKEWRHKYDPSCFVCVISSHGEELEMVKTSSWQACVYGTDGEKVFINEITSMFSDTNCEKYNGKPKLFFFQACRSSSKRGNLMYDGGNMITVVSPDSSDNKADGKGDGKTEKGDNSTEEGDNTTEYEPLEDADNLSQLQENSVDNQDLSDGEWDGTLSDDEDEDDTGKGDASDIKHSPGGSKSQMPEPPIGPNEIREEETEEQESPMPEPSKDMVDVNCPKNCLIMFPVTSGRMAFRNSDSGSWMLYYMHKNRQMLREQRNLFQYLTKVCQEMAAYTYDPQDCSKISSADRAKLPSKMCSCIIHKLTQLVIFEPRGKRPLKDVLKQKVKSVTKKIKK